MKKGVQINELAGLSVNGIKEKLTFDGFHSLDNLGKVQKLNKGTKEVFLIIDGKKVDITGFAVVLFDEINMATTQNPTWDREAKEYKDTYIEWKNDARNNGKTANQLKVAYAKFQMGQLNVTVSATVSAVDVNEWTTNEKMRGVVNEGLERERKAEMKKLMQENAKVNDKLNSLTDADRKKIMDILGL